MLDNSESFPIELDTRATRSYLTKLENSPRSLTYTYIKEPIWQESSLR